VADRGRRADLSRTSCTATTATRPTEAARARPA